MKIAKTTERMTDRELLFLILDKLGAIEDKIDNIENLVDSLDEERISTNREIDNLRYFMENKLELKK